MEHIYHYQTLKQQLQTAKQVKERTGMLMSVARLKLKKLGEMEAHNEYASETNAEHGYLGYSIVGYFSTSKLLNELYPPDTKPVVFGNPFFDDEDLPF